ncbi:MAG: alpha/beta hydrolase [Moorea sp. SIO2B7]|nr:alpha/beta hydrolase [Moorena sp. SIO2B7]
MRHHSITCTDPHGTHKMAYTEWGNYDNSKVLICVHGLTRTGRDFDRLAATLAENYRVICPDIVGRGESDWLKEPDDYGYPVYVADILTLLKHLNISIVDWVGTSMGGLIGMFIASQANSPIRRFVINDVGAFIPKEALKRIAKYLILPPPHFLDLGEAEKYIRLRYAPFGNLTDSQWQHLAKNSVKSLPEGGYRLHYDPQIGKPFKAASISAKFKDIEFWQIWESISCPVLLLRGEESDLLLPKTIKQMQRNKSQMQVINFPKIGHAPALMAQEQIEVIKNWLLTE